MMNDSVKYKENIGILIQLFELVKLQEKDKKGG